MGRVKGHSLKGFQHICLVFVGETCILKEELGFKPSTVREVGLFLHNSGNRPSNPNHQGRWLASQRVRMNNNTSHFNLG
jgi:hypothetical protein